jgi:hypothetical protein
LAGLFDSRPANGLGAGAEKFVMAPAATGKRMGLQEKT